MPVDMVIWLLVTAFTLGAVFSLGITHLMKKHGEKLVASVQATSYFRVQRKPSSPANDKDSLNRHE